MRKFISIIIGGLLVIGAYKGLTSPDSLIDNDNVRVFVVEDGVTFPVLAQGDIVEEFLAQTPYALHSGDRVIPARNARIVPEMTIEIMRLRTVRIDVDGNESICETYAQNVREALSQCGVAHDEDSDEIVPTVQTSVFDDMTISVSHIASKDEVREIDTPFRTITRSDKSIPFGVKKVVEKGVLGRVRVTERVTYKGGKEIAREEVARDVVADPKDEIVVIGQKVKLGKKHTGQASWYAYKGCNCAANPWLPKGSYVKVTNRANGKSVIVRINDRGPFVPGRIIDLDVTAFKKIASKGAGVIDVIMEEVKE